MDITITLDEPVAVFECSAHMLIINTYPHKALKGSDMVLTITLIMKVEVKK